MKKKLYIFIVCSASVFEWQNPILFLVDQETNELTNNNKMKKGKKLKQKKEEAYREIESCQLVEMSSNWIPVVH